MTSLPIAPSRIILGTMRWTDADRTAADWAGFLEAVYGLGISTLHSSSEYDTFPLLCVALAELRSTRPEIGFRHVVKLADPHFGEDGFDAGRLEARVDVYRSALGVDRIDDIQWMWRQRLDDDAQRIADMTAQADAIAAARDHLVRTGKIGRLLCFPYSPAFGQSVVATGAVDGLVVYRNASERADDVAITAAAGRHLPTLIIRPFHAGALLADGADPRAMLADALDLTGIEAAILSSNSIDHIGQLVQ
jgi:hypothetical protein